MNQVEFDFADQQQAILQALQAQLYEVDGCEPGKAKVRFVTGHCGNVTWQGGWVVVRASVERSDGIPPSFDRLQNALHLNALSDRIRFVMSREAGGMAMLADFPMLDIGQSDHELLYARTVDLCTTVNAALETEHCGSAKVPAWTADDETDQQPDIFELTKEAGWIAASSHNDQCRVDLELSHGYQQAVVEQRQHSTQLSAELLDETSDVSGECRYATSLYLMTAVADVRLVNATVDLRDTGFCPRLRVDLPRHADATWLHYGLAALSVAYGACIEQVEILSNSPPVASRFLQMQMAADTDLAQQKMEI